MLSSSDPPHPDFSGRWTMNADKSRLQIHPPDSSLFVIEHTEPHFRLSRTHSSDGVSDTFSIVLVTDGTETVTTTPQFEMRTRCYWQGSQLAVDSRIFADGVESTNLVRYSLSADRLEFTAEERFLGPSLCYDNLWVFDRE